MRLSIPATKVSIKQISVLALLVAVTVCNPLIFAQEKAVKSNASLVSTHQFLLLKQGQAFFLQPLPATASQPRIPIPKEWLIPPQPITDDDDTSPVDPFNYDRHVTSFPIGNGEIGLRFSSFDAMTEGSMALGEGRDVFLIYNPSGRKLRLGLDLGVTKERDFDDGCFHAEMVHLLVADLNEDGLTDIGAVKEEIWCPNHQEAQDPEAQPVEKKLPPELEHFAETHLYTQHGVAWYTYTSQGWKLDPDSEWMPEHFTELPLTGIALSPVDFVASIVWHSYDPKSWRRTAYVPAYRKRLISEDVQKRKADQHTLKREVDAAKTR